MEIYNNISTNGYGTYIEYIENSKKIKISKIANGNIKMNGELKVEFQLDIDLLDEKQNILYSNIEELDRYGFIITENKLIGYDLYDEKIIFNTYYDKNNEIYRKYIIDLIQNLLSINLTTDQEYLLIGDDTTVNLAMLITMNEIKSVGHIDKFKGNFNFDYFGDILKREKIYDNKDFPHFTFFDNKYYHKYDNGEEYILLNITNIYKKGLEKIYETVGENLTSAFIQDDYLIFTSKDNTGNILVGFIIIDFLSINNFTFGKKYLDKEEKKATITYYNQVMPLNKNNDINKTISNRFDLRAIDIKGEELILQYEKEFILNVFNKKVGIVQNLDEIHGKMDNFIINIIKEDLSPQGEDIDILISYIKENRGNIEYIFEENKYSKYFKLLNKSNNQISIVYNKKRNLNDGRNGEENRILFYPEVENINNFPINAKIELSYANNNIITYDLADNHYTSHILGFVGKGDKYIDISYSKEIITRSVTFINTINIFIKDGRQILILSYEDNNKINKIDIFELIDRKITKHITTPELIDESILNSKYYLDNKNNIIDMGYQGHYLLKNISVIQEEKKFFGSNEIELINNAFYKDYIIDTNGLLFINKEYLPEEYIKGIDILDDRMFLSNRVINNDEFNYSKVLNVINQRGLKLYVK